MWSDKSTQSIVQEGKRLALVRCSGVMIWVWGDFLQAGRWGAAESGQDKSHLRGCMKSSEDSTEECRPKLSALGAARMIPSFLEIDRSATVRTATVNKDGEMERHIHEVIQHTVGGITIGMMWGAYKGSVDNAHLRHQYAEFRDSRQPYRMPMNFVVAANASASMGWKLGFLAGSFAACRAFIRVQNPRILESLQKSDIQILRTGANLLKDPVASDILPITGAGTIVGILYGGIGGGMKGIQRGTLVGGGVSFAAAGLQAGLESLSRSLDQMQAKEEAEVLPDVPEQKTEASLSAEELTALLHHLRQREKDGTGQQLSFEKDQVKRRLKELRG